MLVSARLIKLASRQARGNLSDLTMSRLIRTCERDGGRATPHTTWWAITR